MAHPSAAAESDQQQQEHAAPGAAVIQDQLQRILSSPFFSGSRRSSSMLRHVVQQTLDGQSHELKERTLGVEVFHRSPDYDTNADPIVRLTASDIRKRLAQYYCEPEHEAALRIALPTGSYLPEFHWPESQQAGRPTESAAIRSQSKISSRKQWTIRLAGAAALLLLLLVVGVAHFYTNSTPVERFWKPLRKAHVPVLLCVGQPDHAMGELQGQQETVDSLGLYTLRGDRVTTADAIAAARLAGLLGSLRMAYTLQGADSTTFSDLRQGSNILISGADNPWTLRALHDLRFSFGADANQSKVHIWIADRQHPADHSLLVDFSQPYTSLSQDYAIIGRFQDPSTGRMAVIAAGIGANGTLSAAECLTDNNCLQSILHMDPSHGRNASAEAVLGTQVIGGRSGPPRVLAVHSW